LLPTIRATADPITRDLYIDETSAIAGVPRDMLARELRAAPRAAVHERRAAIEAGPPPEDEAVHVRRRDRRADRRSIGVRAERELIRMLLHQRRYVDTA